MIGSSHRLSAYDRALYRSVAELSTPVLDEPLRRVSDFANFSKPWFLVAGASRCSAARKAGGPRSQGSGRSGLRPCW